MNDKPFLDTNVILYAFRRDDPRSQTAEALLAAGGIISVQILNEFVAMARGKLGRTWEEVRGALKVIRVFCPDPMPLTVAIHDHAVQLADRYGYSIFDSLVIAAAIQAGANTFYSEDMQDGQTIEGLTIRNPFPRDANCPATKKRRPT